MNISRKDFFRKSLFSLGETLCSASGVLKSSEPAIAGPDMADFVPTPNKEFSAVAHNDFCLARNSGCFACMERCEPGAIKLIPGVGIRINQQLCTGCGSCEFVCPVTPKGVGMHVRTIPTPSADHTEQPPQKGESSC
ncbi:MAG: 4Fe-4S binding protein [Desulfuromonadaceae bacterium]